MDINPNIYLYLIYDKSDSKSQEGKMELLNKWCLWEISGWIPSWKQEMVQRVKHNKWHHESTIRNHGRRPF